MNESEQCGELNYKDAYYHLFNHITSIIEQMKTLQTVAESLCIDSAFGDDFCGEVSRRKGDVTL
ncbi:MAG: hypothetical protein LBN40_06520 [Oscillospiraceae bacterium]|jgi:hypothetical protein|nr:hypothetical protein [Oscillospiraceae bacterium]